MNISLFFLTDTWDDTLALIRKSLRSVNMSDAEAFEEATPHIFVIFGASVIIYEITCNFYQLMLRHVRAFSLFKAWEIDASVNN